MLSLDKGDPIARIVDSSVYKKKGDKSKYLLLQTDDYDDDNKKSNNTKPKNKLKDRKVIRRKAINISEDKKEFELEDGVLRPCPDINKERDVIYCAGRSGSGKSTWIANYLNEYLRTYPDNSIVVYSAINYDPAFEKLEDSGKMIRICLDNTYLETLGTPDEITVNDLSNTAVVFDDIGVISNKKIKEHIIRLQHDCLEVGRHNRITLCNTTHKLCNRDATSALLIESSKIVVFPRGGTKNSLKYFLKTYVDLDKEGIQKFLNLPSRWAMINLDYPEHVIYRDGAYLLN